MHRALTTATVLVFALLAGCNGDDAGPARASLSEFLACAEPSSNRCQAPVQEIWSADAPAGWECIRSETSSGADFEFLAMDSRLGLHYRVKDGFHDGPFVGRLSINDGQGKSETRYFESGREFFMEFEWPYEYGDLALQMSYAELANATPEGLTSLPGKPELHRNETGAFVPVFALGNDTGYLFRLPYFILADGWNAPFSLRIEGSDFMVHIEAGAAVGMSWGGSTHAEGIVTLPVVGPVGPMDPCG